MKTEENVEMLKKFHQVWPRITVRIGEKIAHEDGTKEILRTASTLLRLKKDGEWKLVMVRFDYHTVGNEKKLELSWIDCMHRFLSEVQFVLSTWDGTTGILDDDQSN